MKLFISLDKIDQKLNKPKTIFLFFLQQQQEYRNERRNPRHPEVGRAKPPNLSEVRSKVGSKNSNFHRRREPNKVKIFNDKDYMKAVKVCMYLVSVRLWNFFKRWVKIC